MKTQNRAHIWLGAEYTYARIRLLLIIQYSTLLFSTVQYSTVVFGLFEIVPANMPVIRTVQYRTVQSPTASWPGFDLTSQYTSKGQYSTVQSPTVSWPGSDRTSQYTSKVQYRTVQYKVLLLLGLVLIVPANTPVNDSTVQYSTESYCFLAWFWSYQPMGTLCLLLSMSYQPGGTGRMSADT